MSNVVNIRKGAYTRRDVEKGRLSGVIKGFIETLSYVHVSSGKSGIRIESKRVSQVDVGTLINAISSGDRELLNKLTQDIIVDYVENVTYGSAVCIPGSTVKGLLRARLELCKSLNKIALGCMTTKTPTLTSYPLKGSHGWRHARVWGDVVFEVRGDRCNPVETHDYTICKICDLFGAPGIIGRIMPSNFCANKSLILERFDLPYGERLWVIPPSTKLLGSISFVSLTIDELGILFISMGLDLGVNIGKDVLIGKHKYAYKNMGKARFYIESIEFPIRFTETLKQYNILCRHTDGKIVCKDKDLIKVIDTAIDKALVMYPEITNLRGFSETLEKDLKGVAQ